MRALFRRLTATAVLAMLALAMPSWAADSPDAARVAIDVSALGPQIGDSVPTFSLPDQNGQIQTLDSLRGPNGTMLLFHRSADW